MKFFVTGVCGQLGHDVMNELASRGYEGIGSDIAPEYSGVQDNTAVTKMPYISLDITNKEAVNQILETTCPDVVIHCAAWTAVDLAEDTDKQDTVKKINVDGTQYIASACKKLDCKMIYLSTDYVFDGQGTTPWQPDCKNYRPLNIYGQSKLLGEQAVANTLDKYFIVRIAWVFGRNGKTLLRPCSLSAKIMTNLPSLMTRLEHQPTPLTWQDFLLIWPKAKNTATTMSPMKEAILAGMILQKKSFVRQSRSVIQNMMKITLL